MTLLHIIGLRKFFSHIEDTILNIAAKIPYRNSVFLAKIPHACLESLDKNKGSLSKCYPGNFEPSEPYLDLGLDKNLCHHGASKTGHHKQASN